MTLSPSIDRLAVDTIRTLAMDAVEAARSGHPGTPMALAPLGWVLWTRLRRHDPARPDWPDRDRFVLSCGHASMLQYALLHLTGYDLPLEEIRRFRQWGSRTPGHPESHLTPGVETTTGPLGQGVANAVGMAMAERHLARRWNRPDHVLFDHVTWCIASDGDLMEGVASEACSLAGHLRLHKLVLFWDDNRITIDGPTSLAWSEDVCKRFEAYGWFVQSVDDGNDLDAIERAARAALAQRERPSFIRVRTIIGWPAPTKRNTSKAHGAPLGAEEVRRTKEILGWPPDESFRVPQELHAAREAVRARGMALSAQWDRRWEAYRAAFPDEAQELQRWLRGELPPGWDEGLPQFPADATGMASRKASEKVLAVLAPRLGSFVGGSADLSESNLTHLHGEPSFHELDAPRAPRNAHWGIREHAMAAACNGMALHGGVVPFGATFLVFSDYMKPAIRLAALMHLPVRYVFTHDSIGVGEDGPTHQPVEHLAALRSIPGMTVIRPGDANETREAWVAALRCPGPVALVLTRQNLPTLDRNGLGAASGLHRGAYVLWEPDHGTPDAIVIATGSELSVALEGARRLHERGVRTRVVSMPSWELFAAQPAAYRDQVLVPAIRARVVVEAASRFGWERWVGPDGGFVTVDRFGASAPAAVVFEKYGITPDRVVEETLRVLGRG
ncbi:MAG: transketolase [Myxococcota bacterium]|nr:transketolase [Myxococcota bacterium]